MRGFSSFFNGREKNGNRGRPITMEKKERKELIASIHKTQKTFMSPQKYKKIRNRTAPRYSH
jgi:hypothetical protein